MPTSQKAPRDHMRMADWTHVRAVLTWAYEGNVAALFRESREHHPGQSALFLLAGSLTVENEEGVVHAGKGQWIFPRPGPRLQKFSEDAVILSIHFHLNWAGGRPLFEWPVAYVLAGSSRPVLEKQARSLIHRIDRQIPGISIHLPWQDVDVRTYFRIQPSFHAWLCAYVEALTADGCEPTRMAGLDPRVLRAVTILDDLPLTESIRDDQLASTVGLSSSQLCRLFASQFNLTPRQYVEKRKIERASELIENAPLAIKQVAYEMGFGSLPSFSRWFRQKTGMSPRKFRVAGAQRRGHS